MSGVREITDTVLTPGLLSGTVQLDLTRRRQDAKKDRLRRRLAP
jgi:hypothetical protein